jgi:hypothetical protein
MLVANLGLTIVQPNQMDDCTRSAFLNPLKAAKEREEKVFSVTWPRCLAGLGGFYAFMIPQNPE